MWPFTRNSGKKQDDLPPPGINDFASFTTQPGSNGTEASQSYNGKVPHVGDPDFPTGSEQDAILVHWDRPPADQNPQAWWDDRELWEKQADKNVSTVGTNLPSIGGRSNTFADHPNWNPPATNRPMTDALSPSSWRYLRPWDQDFDRELNGIHFSAADNNVAYLLGEMQPVGRGTSTYRLDPLNNDTTAYLSRQPGPSAQQAAEAASGADVYPSRAYRLGG